MIYSKTGGGGEFGIKNQEYCLKNMIIALKLSKKDFVCVQDTKALVYLKQFFFNGFSQVEHKVEHSDSEKMGVFL